MTNIDDVIAGAKLPERTHTVCLRGDLQARWEDLERQLETEQANSNAADESLAGNPRLRELADEMEAIGKEMTAHEVVFTFRGLPAEEYSDLMAAHKAAEDDLEESVDGLDWKTFPMALVAASAADPAMSLEQAKRLYKAITHRQWDDLFQCALACNRSKVSIPFSLSASAIRAATEPKPKQPARGASPEAGSSDESLAG